MNNRVKAIRKSKTHDNNTLEKFGESIGIKKSALSHIESGRNALTEQNIKAICREYNVNEEWLRTGEGEMFIELSRKDKILKWATESLTCVSEEYKNRFVDVLDALDVDDWEILANMAETMANRHKKKKD